MLKSLLVKPFASYIHQKVKKEAINALDLQMQTFKNLLQKASKTYFGKNHEFSKIKTYEDYVNAVPIRDYEGLSEYITEMLSGKENILWPGRPLYYAKTSGTTSGTKFIPITKDSVSYHVGSARNALMCYISQQGKTDLVNGKMIFLSGSPELIQTNGVLTGRLSGIVNHHVPAYLRGNQLPSYQTNSIEDWEQKLDAIVAETKNQNMTLISGIPPWVQMYFDKLLKQSNKASIKDIFPNFNVFVYGGVNYEPYRAQIEKTIGKRIDSIETYPASEGFIAFQDDDYQNNTMGLLLLPNNGIFYEFIEADTFYSDQPKRIWLKDVEVGKNYVLILNTNAGLFGYNIGDTIKFLSINPYRIVVTGRIKHFISAFGEHVIGEEVEHALKVACSKLDVQVAEFTVAPKVNVSEGELPHHEWLIEFTIPPNDIKQFELDIDNALCDKNAYYKDLIIGNVLQPLKIRSVNSGSFIAYMKALDKLGGQNKVPRLSNDRIIADHEAFNNKS
jgi:hypothetical protein